MNFLKSFLENLVGYIRHILGIGEVALLPADKRQARPLTIVVAIMCALGCMAGLGARAGFRAADQWTDNLKTSMTALIEAPKDENSLKIAVEIIKSQGGIKSANIMTRKQAKELLKNYGANIGELIDELPLPNIIEISLKKNSDTKAKDIETALKSEGFTAQVDDHSSYLAESLRSSKVVRSLALISLVSLLAAAVAAIGFAARSALQSRHESVEILHMVGAADEFVAHEVQARFMRLGLISGTIGALIAGIITFGANYFLQSQSSDFTNTAPILRWYDVWILFLAPFVTAAASAIAAKLAARDTLRELV